eukprot:m.227512 g.227512  ORF g.227512 m.227512 type:complete len:800 (+) comp17238_c0_seq1:3-2402(+)
MAGGVEFGISSLRLRGLMLVMGVALLLGFSSTPATGLHVAQSIKEQLHHVELMHTSRTQRRTISWGRASFTVDFLNMSLNLNLRHNEALFPRGIRVIEVLAEGVEREVALDRENYWIGEVAGDADSHVDLYISPKGFFQGNIYYKGERYILESAYRHYNTSKHEVDAYTVVYRASDLINTYNPHTGRNASGHSFCGVAEDEEVRAKTSEAHIHAHKPEEEVHHDEFAHRMRRATGPVGSTNKYCLVTVVADSLFYNANGANTAAVTASMIGQISAASDNFKTTSWYTSSPSSISYSNLELTVSTVYVFPNASTDPYQSVTYSGSAGPQNVLSRLSQAPTISGGWGSTCLAHLFTHFSFSGGTLGLAWVASPAQNLAGGVCHSSSNSWLNTGWTTDLNNGSPVVTLMGQLVTQHEIGHNWGSPHDTAGAECLGSANNRYVMYPTAVSGNDPNNRLFSPCSIRNITLVLQAKGNCFSASADGVCGDYAKRGTEQCDAGPTGDACCTGQSNVVNASCRYKPGAVCSDTTDVCCRNCVNSSTAQCYTAFFNDRQCRGNATCVASSASTCPTTPKTAGEPCNKGGLCDGTSATESACKPFCSRFGAASCSCGAPNECRICCVHQANLTQGCDSPFKNYNVSGVYQCTMASTALAWVSTPSCLVHQYWTTRLGTTIRLNATQRDPACTAATCWGILDYQANEPCSAGVCDASGTCAELPSTTVYSWATLSSLSLDNALQWMRQNIVGTVLIFSFVVWLPLGCLVHRSDVKKRMTNANYGMRQSSTMTFRPKNSQDLGARRPGGRH